MDIHPPLTSDDSFIAAVRAMLEEDHGVHLSDSEPPRSTPIDIPTQPDVLESISLLAPGSPPPISSRRSQQRQPQQGALPEFKFRYRATTAVDSPSVSAAQSVIQFGVPLLFVNGADTLVYIDPAPGTGASNSSSVPLRVRSESLLKTGSPYFQELFEPQRQARLLRRRGLTESLPGGLRYILDLTPALQDEAAVIYMTELSCPEGIRTWGRNQKRFDLPIHCVGGPEDMEQGPQWSSQASQSGNQGLSRTFFSASGRPSAPATPHENSETHRDVNQAQPVHGFTPQENPCLPLDYSPIRHRSCIERVLHTLEGLSPKLDTAPKLWTFFASAKLMGVASETTISDYILSWFYTNQNSLFIELHPELTYRVACGIRSASLCRETFAILVGEEALLLLHNSKSGILKRPHKTLHGRTREALDDEELQRIEYASKNFMERILTSFVELVGTRMTWLLELSEYKRLVTTASYSVDAAAVFNLTVKLKQFIRGRIITVLLAHLQTYSPSTLSILETRWGDYPQPLYWDTYYSLRALERIFSRTFWKNLLLEHLSDEIFAENVGQSRPFGMSSCIADLGRHLPALKGQEAAKCGVVSMSELHLATSRVNMNGYRFDLSKFFTEAIEYIRNFAQKMLQSPRQESTGPFELVDTLTCLDDGEYRYLALWAGGNDDGTGGVFTDHNIPVIEQGGFSAPGPSVHTGSIAASLESFSIVDGSEGMSTAQVASHQATDGLGADVVSVGSMRNSLWEDVIAHRDSGQGAETESLFSWDNPTLSEADDEENLTDVASDDSGTIIVGSPGLVDPFNDDEELDLEEGDPLDFSDGDD